MHRRHERSSSRRQRRRQLAWKQLLGRSVEQSTNLESVGESFQPIFSGSRRSDGVLDTSCDSILVGGTFELAESDLRLFSRNIERKVAE